MKVNKIVLTGGPCAGKTKILEYLREELPKKGYYVIVVSETASEYIRGNMPPKTDREHVLMFQDIMLRTQLVKENSAEKYADLIKEKQEVVILYDRAIMDNRAYLSQEDFDSFLKMYNLDEMKILDKYDLVIDLISTATLKKDSYELNDTRSESVGEAKKRDELTSLAWLSHKNLKVIKPTNTLDEKKVIVLNYICDWLLNNQKFDDIEIEIDKNESCFSMLNSNNSKEMVLRKVWLNKHWNTDMDCILTQRKSGNYSSLTLDKVYNHSLIESIPINDEQYIELIGLYGINKTENISKTAFIENGNYFQFINRDENMYIKTNCENIDYIPDNIVLKDKKINYLVKK